MPSLSLIATEAERLIEPLRQPQRHELQKALIELCEAHWEALRGPQPDTAVASALWAITPVWSDLVLDLYAAGDPRLMVLLPRSKLATGLALVVLAEIERGNEVGVHIAHEPMMAFESAVPPASLLERIASLVRGVLASPVLHRHDHHESVWKAVALIAAQTGRLDLPAVLKVISLLAGMCQNADSACGDDLVTLRNRLLDVGIRFKGIDAEHVYLEQHGHAHKPIRTRQLGEMLLEIRRKWLR